MAEPFKNLFNPQMIRQMSDHIAAHCPAFKANEFIQLATTGLDELELKARSNQIRDALIQTLPTDFDELCEALLASLHPEADVPIGKLQMDEQGIRGWAIMPMADVIAVLGIEHFDASMNVLAEMTCRLSSEFAVRHFFIANPSRAIAISMQWAQSPNEHVRRLASEGSRPRLPWGLRLQGLVENPQPLLPLLEALKDDPSEYVRRSVANNINDIAKDHPVLVAELASRWLENASKERTKLVKHACRGLIKQGHPETLTALGYKHPQLEVVHFTLSDSIRTVGDSITIEVEARSTASSQQPLIIDYAVHHVKANGQTSAKVFKWKLTTFEPNSTLKAQKKHSLKAVSTRKYYAGTHKVELLINGQSMAYKQFELAIS